MKKRSVKAKKMPNGDQLQALELRRNGYTRPNGGTKRTQDSQLNRKK